MVASVLKRGNVAIVSYATDPIGPDGDDIIRFVILTSIGSGTQIFFSDRNWNGTAFPAAGGGDGTFTYVAGADLPAGTVITITSAQLLAAGMDLSNGGDTIYVYQGTNADTPTTFLFAIDIGDADNNHVFEAGELTGTGLTAGVDAVAVGLDQASFAGQSTQIPQTQLTAISDFTRWHGHSGDDIGGTIYDDRADVTLSGPLNNPDMQLFGMMSGGGQSDAFIRMDNDEGANVATNLTRLFRDNPSFTHLTDLAFDIEDGVWFAVDNDGSSTTRLLKGNIADLVSGTMTPTITVLYDFPNDDDNVPVDDDSFIDGIEIDTAGNKIYFIQGDIVNGHSLKSIGYAGGAVTDYGLIQLATEPTVGFFGGVFDFTLDVAHNTAYFTYVLVNSTPPPSAAINYIVKLNSLSNPAGGYSIVQINGSDDPDGAGGNPANHFPQAEGSLAGIDIDIANQRLYFVTQRLGATGTAGVFMLDLVTHNYVELWQQQSNNATNTLQPFPTTQMEYIEVDTIGGRYYVSTLNNTDTAVGHDGTATDEGGSRIFSGALATTAGQPAPTVFASVFENTANGAVLGMEIDYAPTLTLGSAGSTYTESTNLPGSPAGPTVDVATSPSVNDADQAIIQGATVAISTGFVAGDQLTFTNSGGITGSYNATTGVVTFTGNASFAAYQTVLDSVRFTNAGDNPTDYGASTSRIISFTVTDGLLNSDPATATVLVVGINDAPVNTIQGAALAISEDALNAVLSTTGNAISVFDVDANPATQDIRVTLSVTQGTLTILTNVTGGIIAGDITAGANGTSTITITATQNQINATLAATNGLLYNPIADYNGSDTLTIVTNDLGLNGNDPGLTGTGTSEQDSDSRTINIAAVVDIANDPVTVGEDSGTTTIDVLANDSFENPARFISSVTQGLHGTVVIVDGPDADGIMDYVTYTPIADYNGSDSFTYTVTSGGVTETATVNMTITAVVDIANDTLLLTEDAPTTTVDVLANDTFENAGRSITAVTQGLHGFVAINDNNTVGDTTDDYVTYTAVADYNGSDSFTYTVTSGGVTETATVNVTISAVADIVTDSVDVVEDSGANVLDVLGNDTFENAGRFISLVTQGLHGTVAIIDGPDADSVMDYVTYTPALNYNGPDSFTYTVTSGGVTETTTVNVNVTAVNDAPVNVVPPSQIISEDGSVTFSTGNGNVISVSDIDVLAGNLTVTLSIESGSLTLSGTAGLVVSGNSSNLVTLTGTAAAINTALNGLVYAPPTNFNGSRTLTVTTNDNGNTGSDPGGDPGSEQDVDTVTININAVNDTPVVSAAATGSSTEQVAGTVDATATIADADLDALNSGNGNYAGATLNIANNGGNDANDLFAIGTSGAFTVNGANLEAGGLVFATFAGGNGTPLVVSFTSSGTAATTALVNAVVQSIQYTYTGDNPPVAGIDVAISVNDGAPANAAQGSIAGHPAVGTDIIHLSITNTPENANPVINNLNGDIATFTEGDVAAVLLDDSSAPELAVTVTDPDNPTSFNGGSLTVSITANENAAQDVLGVSTGGTVTLSNGTNVGSVVSVGGLAVGTVTANGGGGNDLVIAFDTADATPANISTLVAALTYFNTGGLDPSTAARTVSVTVTDGLGGSGSANVTVNVVGINQEPTLVATGANPTLTEGGLPADLFGAVTASTIESAQTFASMTLTVTNVTDGASESLTFDGSTVALTNGNSVLTATNGLTVNVTVVGTTATVTFSGAALSVAALQTLVDGLAYGNSSDNPTDANRVVTITEIVDSGSNVAPNDNTTALSIASTVNVDPVNDNPINSVPGTQTINEDGSVTLSTGNGNAISVADPDATVLTVTLTVAHGTLTLASTTNLSFGTGDGSDDTTMTFTGTATDINAALGSGLTYTPNGDFNGSDSIAVSTTDNGQAGSGGTQTDNDSVTVNITAINDAPVVIGDGTESATTINEDMPGAGQTIQALFAGQYSDAADNQIPNGGASSPGQFSGIAVTANGSSGATGQWQYFSGGVWTDIGAVSDAAAKLFGDPFVTLIRFNPAPDFNGPAPELTVHLIDNSLPFGIVNGQVVDLSGMGATGGTTAYSADTVVLSQDVTAVNDAPLNSVPGSQTINEDGSFTLSTGNGNAISVADVDASTMTVTLTVTHGTLTLASTASLSFGTGDGTGDTTMTFTGTAADINAALGSGLTYNPTANYNGPDSIAVSTTDNGQTGTGPVGVDNDSVNITINSVNDEPAGANNTVTGSEDDPLVFTAADFGFTDPLDSNAFFAVRIMSFPMNGTLYLDTDGPGGAAPTDLSSLGSGVYVSVTDINLGRLYFQPDPDEYGDGYASFDFAVQDDGGILNGGQDTDQTPNTMTIDIDPDNLPPVVDLDGGTGGVNYTTIYVEDAPGVAIGSGVTVSDPDSGLGDMIESAVITLTDLVAGDSLTLTGVLPPGFLAVTNVAAGSITMTITGSGTGAQYQALIQSILYATTNQDPTVGGTDPARTITVVVNDGTINSAVATTTVNITALDDAPIAQPDAFTITESGTIMGGNLFASNGSGADNDPDGPPLAVSAVGGGPGANVGTQFTLDSGATLTVRADGTFDYNPGSIFLPTPTAGSGASNTPSHDSFTYTLAGGNTVTVNITLTGLDTNDTLLGTAGADYLSGGNGNDTYYVENGADQVNELLGGGNDRVIASVNYTLVGGTYVETLEAAAGSAPLVLIGNAFDNAVIGNAGANVLHGGGGAGDVLTGLGGNDTYYTDVATTQIVEVAGGGTDALYTSVSYTLGGNADVETLSTNDYGSTAALNLTGNYLNQTLIGNAGANILHGGGGADVLVGLLGNDIYYVDVAATTVQEAAGGGNDIVYASTGYALAAGQSVEILSTNNLAATAAINLTGNNLAQTVFGNAGANIIQGGGGADMLYGLGGNDTYYVDDAAARIFENAGGGSDSVYASVSYALVADQEIELLSTNAYAATTAINLTGNNLANTIIGNAGANVLDGQGGNDTLIGLDGADTFAFTTALGAGNVDNVMGFVHGTDKIGIDDAIFTAAGGLGALNANAFFAGAAAHDADDRIIYNAATGQLFYDADGNGGGAAVLFANLSPGLGLTASDFQVI